MALKRWDRYDPDTVTVLGEQAVVLGGSIAGLCAARVLSDAFDEVVVLERDPLPDEAVARDGAPQTGHPHVLLEAGRATLEELFPDFSQQLAAAGALVVDAGTKMQYYQQGGVLADTPEPHTMYCASRPLVEYVVRQRVAALENVEIREGHQFTDFNVGDDSDAISGVTCRVGNGSTTDVVAELVVDATGRASKTPAWLAEHGYPKPPVDEVHVDVTYSTIRIERPPSDQRVLVIPPAPPRTRGGFAIPIEGDRWEVMLQSIHGDDPPTDPATFVEYAESLPLEAFEKIIRSQPWVCEEIHQYPFPSSVRRRYETLAAFPDGLVVTGDALASFNPIYGQGMSVAALDALQLHHSLADGDLGGFPTRFFDRAADVVGAVWKLAVVADFEFPQTTGPEPHGTSLFNRYVARLTRRAQTDSVLADAYYRVFRLEEPPTSLVRPGILWRVFRPLGRE